MCFVVPSIGRRLQWMKTRLDVTQWEEEVEILLSEMRRVYTYNCTMHATWTKLGSANMAKTGYMEYALQAADVYAKRAAACKAMFMCATPHGLDLPQIHYSK